jgi:hypothetical protein
MAVPTSLDAWVRVLTLLPIFACSVVGLAITLAKWVQLRRSGEHTLGQARALMGEREYGRAVAVARADRSAVARLTLRSAVTGLYEGASRSPSISARASRYAVLASVTAAVASRRMVATACSPRSRISVNACRASVAI